MEGQMSITDFCDKEVIKVERRIPDKVWTQQCQTCTFRDGNENVAFNKSRYTSACRLNAPFFESIYDGERDWTPEQWFAVHMCGHWRPTKAYEREKHCCVQCRHWNPFECEKDEDGNVIQDESNYCTHRNGPLNKTKVWSLSPAGPSDSWKHVHETCERWEEERT